MKASAATVNCWGCVMADITLAEFNGRVWLVGGEPYIDDLLANTLAPEISIELVPCESKSEVHALWVQNCGQPTTPSDPWMIHPAIVERIRRTSSNYSVFFAEWSAALDKDAHAVIASVAAWAMENPSATLDLVEFLDPAGPKAIADLSRLRAQLIEDELVKAGVQVERIGRATRETGDVAGLSQESQRIDLVVKNG
jgi:outer membrane protein OmpA-like peptidoglycan-associated protein